MEPATDATLVAGVLSGDRAAFAAIYDRYADRLHDFCWSMLRDRDEAADATQDTFLLAAERLGQLRDPERLRPWLYAVARSQALRRLRARRHIDREAEVIDVATTEGGPERAAEQADLRALVWDAAAGLSDRDRALLDLHLRQGLDGAELGEAIGVNAAHASVLLHRLREQVERSLGALLVARLGSDDCAELRSVLAGWDGRFSPLLRKRVARHVDGCAVCDDRRQRVASPVALLSTVPLVPAPTSLRRMVLDEVVLTSHRRPPGGRARAIAGAAAVAAVVAGVALFALTRPGAEPVAQPLPSEPASAAVTAAEEIPTIVVPSETTPAPQPPALLSVSAATLDLGARDSSGVVTIANDGGVGLGWSAAPSVAWVGVEPAGGDLGPGERADLTVSVDRAALGEGSARASIAVSSDGGDATVDVALDEERAPVIGPLTVSPPVIGARGCGETSALATVTVTDEAGVESVTLSWTGPASDSVPMTLRSGSWYSRVGPSNADGELAVTVEATDIRGNRATADPVTVRVAPCPALVPASPSIPPSP